MKDEPLLRTTESTSKVTTATLKTTSTPEETSTSTLQIGSLLQNTSCRRINLNLTYPHISIVASLGNGRLGNQLSNFASCYAIWKEYGMYHHLNSMQLQLLENVFQLPQLEDQDNDPYYFWNTGKCI